jgi:hypothetical protein
MRYLIGSLLLSFLASSPLSAQFTDPPSTPEEYRQQYAWRIRQEKLNGVYIPRDIQDAFAQLDRKIDGTSKIKFAALPEEQAFRRLFHSFGRWIIRNWGLYEGSRYGDYLKQAGLTHPEDMAEFTIVSYHRRLNERPLAGRELRDDILRRRAEYFRTHIQPPIDTAQLFKDKDNGGS